MEDIGYGVQNDNSREFGVGVGVGDVLRSDFLPDRTTGCFQVLDEALNDRISSHLIHFRQLS